MSYTVVTTERAAREIEDAAAWWAHQHSVEQAERWYQGIRSAIADLADSPERCAVAPEQQRGLPYDVRELHYGLGSKPTHRVLFTIVGETVLVLTVRHAARRPPTTWRPRGTLKESERDNGQTGDRRRNRTSVHVPNYALAAQTSVLCRPPEGEGSKQ
jgi:plasmid stabilization system protein ParE